MSAKRSHNGLALANSTKDKTVEKATERGNGGDFNKEKKSKTSPVLDLKDVQYRNMCDSIGRQRHEYHRMVVFRCRDCAYDRFDAMCYACSKVCHSGHAVDYVGLRKYARCDCLGSCPEQGQKPDYTLDEGPAQPVTSQVGCRFRGELIKGKLSRREMQATAYVHNEDDDLILGPQENLEERVKQRGYVCYTGYLKLKLPVKANSDESSASDADDPESSVTADKKDRTYKPRRHISSDDSSSDSLSEDSDRAGSDTETEIVQQQSAVLSGKRTRRPSHKAAQPTAKNSASGSDIGGNSGAKSSNSTHKCKGNGAHGKPAGAGLTSNNNGNAASAAADA